VVSAQTLLSEYLQYDLYHSVGAYSVAQDHLLQLEEKMKRTRTPPVGDVTEYEAMAEDHDAREQAKLLNLTQQARQYNDQLARKRHFAHRSAENGPPPVLVPKGFPLTLAQRFSIERSPGVEDARRNPWATPLAWAWVLNYYDAAIAAIDVTEDSERRSKLEHSNPEAADLVEQFASSMVWPRDRPTATRPSEERERRRQSLRKARFERRRDNALAMLPGIRRETPHRSDDATEFIPRIATDNLGSGYGSLPLFVVSALAEAHLTHHAVEAWQSMSFKAHAEHAARHLTPRRDGLRDEFKWDASKWLHNELDRCIVLDTFVYSASRCAPWIFAADDAECRYVFENFAEAWDNAVPTRCMWIAVQMVLLTLHRRAYSYMLKGERKLAYNDYYKLQRHIREARRRVDAAPLHIADARDFLACLEARANQNIGELYRAEHAQQPALKHFRTAHECLEKVDRSGEMGRVLTNSRWQVELLISRGKASYEIGRHKEALRWHLEGWRSFLELMAAEMLTETSTGEVDRAIEWLDEIRLEPELHKEELQEHLRPVVDQLDRLQVEERYGGLAADILLRLGHVLLVLRLGITADPSNPHGNHLRGTGLEGRELRKDRFAETLAFPCLKMAARCDPHSTLIVADLLKIRLRLVEQLRGKSGDATPEHERELELPEIAPVANQWPRGGDDYERISRVAEYLTLLSMDPDTAHERSEGMDLEDEAYLARSLLLNLFMHTDSINVRKAQTHRFLMRERAPAEVPKDAPNHKSKRKKRDRPHGTGDEGTTATGDRETLCHAGADVDDGRDEIVEPTIEYVCMRRYSSAFPLLPRPSAFRAHGGGYFIRLHRRWHRKRKVGAAIDPCPEGTRRPSLPAEARPFGIVVDPGPDFIENLYRTGFSLSDIDMIVVTHDHVDHLNSLESLLSLMNYRDGLLARQSTVGGASAVTTGKANAPVPAKDDEPAGEQSNQGTDDLSPLVYGNKSIVDRYSHVSVLNPGGARFRSLEKIGEDARVERAGFKITAMSSAAVDGDGHLDLSREPSYGVCFEHEDASLSLAITSDTPAPQRSDKQQHAAWIREWKPALEADVLIAHISTVPLTELRQMAGLDARLSIPERDIDALVERIDALNKRAEETLKRIDTYEGRRRAELDRHREEVDRGQQTEEALERVKKAAKHVRKLKVRLKGLHDTLVALRSAKEGGSTSLDQTMEDVHAAGGKLVKKSRKLLPIPEPPEDPPPGDEVHDEVLRDQLSGLALDAAVLGQTIQGPPKDVEELEKIRTKLQDVDPDLRGRVEFSMWLRSREPGPTADLVGFVEGGDSSWLPPREHPYLKGTLAWARAYRAARKEAHPKRPNGLFVLGELSEELGTARGKIAGEINEKLFEGKASPGAGKEDRPEQVVDEQAGNGPKRSFTAVTSDIGLRIVVVPAADGHSAEGRPEAGEESGRGSGGESGDAGRGIARILCTTCELDTDRIPDERYHAADCIREVCVKGENEGIFYNCTHHDPGAEHVFLEQLERFDVFGR
jgi:tetratricopeptide (TPR) repeat protein